MASGADAIMANRECLHVIVSRLGRMANRECNNGKQRVLARVLRLGRKGKGRAMEAGNLPRCPDCPF